jgi:carboxylate-amine ligase
MWPRAGLPTWAQWRAGGRPWTVGVEEELMLLDRRTWAAAHRIGAVLAAAPDGLRPHLSAETHACVAEIRTHACATVGEAAAQLAELRRAVDRALRREHDLRAAAAGTHPLLEAADVVVTPRPRYQEIARTMRSIARREPTMGLHVHVGVPDGDAAVRALDGLRADVPALIALSANSPFWHGEDSGFASIRTPLLSMFPRMGLPRSFGTYRTWVMAIDALVSAGAVADAGFVWWDVRLQPRLGTVEVRVMDSQTRVTDSAALAALVQCLVRRHVERRPRRAPPPEVLAENRFLAARDGMAAHVIDVTQRRRVALYDLVQELLRECRGVATELGCLTELIAATDLLRDPGDARQRRIARRGGIVAVPERLAAQFSAGAPAAVAAG